MFGPESCVRFGCSCIGHRLPGVHHMVACCDEPHIEFIDSTNPDEEVEAWPVLPL